MYSRIGKSMLSCSTCILLPHYMTQAGGDAVQGLSCWVGLKSRRGEPVGAVQIKARLTQLKGRPHPDCRYTRSALICCQLIPIKVAN